jgi:hypothetical protein
LRKRITRDVTSRTLRAPELNTPPLAEMPLDLAVESLCDQLAKAADWRRLYRVLEGRANSQGQPGGRTNDDGFTALRSFFTAQNLELAEQWPEAVQAYKSVLQSASERAPVQAAADRLKVLAKEHPDAMNPSRQLR